MQSFGVPLVDGHTIPAIIITDKEKSRLALLQAKLQQFYDGDFGTSNTKEVGKTRKKLEAKVG